MFDPPDRALHAAASKVASYAASSTNVANGCQSSVGWSQYATGRAEQKACETNCPGVSPPSVTSTFLRHSSGQPAGLEFNSPL